MANVGADTALHIARVAVAATLTAVEKNAFPVTKYHHIKECILHSMKSGLSAVAPKPEVISRMSL